MFTTLAKNAPLLDMGKVGTLGSYAEGAGQWQQGGSGPARGGGAFNGVNPGEARQLNQDLLGQLRGIKGFEGVSELRVDPNGGLVAIRQDGDKRLARNVLLSQDGTSIGPSGWKDVSESGLDKALGRVAEVGVPLALTALGGYTLGGGAGLWGGDVGLSGMDLAADAAIGTGNNIATAGGALGGGGTIAGTTIPQFSQLPGYGNNVATLADASGASPFTGGVDQVGNYLTSGASEGSTLGNALTGAGGTSGAVGAGTTAGTLGQIGGAVSGLGNLLGGNSGLLNLGGNLLNSFLGYRASNNAADAQINASREANALNKAMFDQIRADNMPALQARNTGLSGYQNLLKNPGQIVNDPGYKFGLQQGQAAYDNSGAARGMRLSGGQAKALTKFGQDYGQTKFDQSLNRFGNLAGLGGTGAQTIAGAGQNYANNAGQNITGAGNAAASGYIGGANAVAGGVNNFLRNWQETNLLRQLGIGG